MRILIVGGGVAGLTLAAKLKQQGRHPVVVEKAPEYTDIGYGLGLYPLGSCVFHGLGIWDEFVARGQPSERYDVADHHGEVLQSAAMDSFTAHMGAVMMIPRTDVIDLLREACGDVDISMGTTVDALTQADNQVEVTLSDGSDATFDLVVACDGIHSDLRTMVFGEQKPFDTGWLLWTWWADVPEWPAEIIREFWGPGRFFGMYPCRSKVMCGIGLPTDQDPGCHDDPDAAKAFLREQHAELIAGEPLVGKAIDGAESFFPWPMTDVRSQDWVNDRVVLCGDAGAAFLPTAGVGASNALRAAAALSDELSRAGPSTVPLALELYEKRCRKVIEGNQHDSRTAAKLMFVENKAVSWGRDHLVKHYPADKIINQIVESMRTPF